jgi:hypothetical protein
LLIAEEFLLVALRADGSARCSRTTLSATLRGALLVELVLDSNAALDGTVVVAVGTAPEPAEPVLAEGIVARLRASVVDGVPPDHRTAALAGLVHAARLGRQVFPDADLRAVNRRLAEIADGDWAADAVRKAIRAAQAATSAAVAAASTSATSGS